MNVNEPRVRPTLRLARERGVFVATGMLLASFSHAVNPYAIAYERNVPVRMRDGVELRADIYRPDAEESFRSSCSALHMTKTMRWQSL